MPMNLNKPDYAGKSASELIEIFEAQMATLKQSKASMKVEEGEILAALRRAHAILCAHAIELDCDAVIEEIDAVLAKATTTN